MDLYKYSRGKVFCVNTETEQSIPRIMKIFIFGEHLVLTWSVSLLSCTFILMIRSQGPGVTAYTDVYGTQTLLHWNTW